ncbi:MAG: ZIP family metal transporter [Nanoarchaeota archaeon]|nr:ZIP family metal transporter [Nanoarchaeota archaeon]
MDAIWIIVVLSVLGPILGSLIGVLGKPNEKFMFNMLAFAAGVMISISFLELIPEAIAISSVLIAGIGLLFGALIIYGLDLAIPHLHPELCGKNKDCRMKKASLYLLFGIFLHNFPEGMAIGIGAVSGTKLGLIVAIAIAIQNVPEGICTSAPCYYCDKKKLKSFLLSAATAIPILVGFLLTYYVFKNISFTWLGLITSMIAGLMIYISADELIPSSSKKVTDHRTIFYLIAGILVVVFLGLL